MEKESNRTKLIAILFLFLIYLTFISLGLPDSILGAAWPVVYIDLGVSFDSLGIVSMVIVAGTIFSSLISSRFIKRFGTGIVASVSVLATAIAMIGYSLGSSLFIIAVFAILWGLGGGAIDVAMNNFVSRYYDALHMSWLHGFWGVGAFIGPLIIGVFINNNENWRGGFFAVAMILFAISILLFITLPVWKNKESGGDREPESEKTEEAFRKITDLSAAKPIQIRGVRDSMVAILVYCALQYTVGLWGSSFLVYAREFTAAQAAAGISLFFIGITAGRFLNGFLTRKFSASQLIRLGILLISAGTGLLFVPAGGIVPLIALLLLGIGCAPVYPTMMHETPRRFGSKYSSNIIGYQTAAAYIGATFFPPVVGLAANNISIFAIPVFIAILAVTMLFSTERINNVLSK